MNKRTSKFTCIGLLFFYHNAAEQQHRVIIELNRNSNKTIIMVTHSADAAAYGNRIISVKDGFICSS
ncbi:MAG TPA: hypothetical protein VJY54_00055 [Lachnospiraceae bacterium]|nr:hypothetical protein [Lachnospiraceae bacterium]